MYLLSYDLLKTSKTSRNDCALRKMKRCLVFRDKTFRVLTAVCCSGALSWIRFGQVEVINYVILFFTNQRVCFVFSIPNDNIVCSTVDALLQIKRCKLELEIFMFSVKWNSPCAVQFVRIHGVMVRRYDFTFAFCYLLNTVCTCKEKSGITS